MPKVTKRQKTIQTILRTIPNIDNAQPIDIAFEALEKYTSKAKAKFDESIDVMINVNLDGKSVNSSIVLPHGNGKKQKIIAFVNASEAKALLDLGVMKAGLDELIQEVLDGFVDFDKCIASQDVFPAVSKKLAKVLGPKGLMPSIKSGTVGTDVMAIAKNVLGGQVSFKANKNGCISTSVGKLSFKKEQILENINALVSAVRAQKPSGVKVFLKTIYISTTMGFGIKVIL